MPLDPTNWKSPAAIIASVIDTALSEFVLGINLFVGFMPDEPANAVCVMDSGGGEQDSINKIDDVSFQIFSRNTSYKTGYNLQNLIKANLERIDPVVLDGETVIGIWVKSNIAFIGRDESERSLFSSNYRAKIDTNKNINRI